MIEWIARSLGLPPPTPPTTLDGWAVVIGTMVAVFMVLFGGLRAIGRWAWTKVKPSRLVELDKVECVPLFHIEGQPPTLDLIQVWFKNLERTRVAKDVTAHVEMRDPEGTHMTDAHCMWAIGTEPSEAANWKTTAVTTDVLPNNIAAKLNVAYRVVGETAGQLYTEAKAPHPIPQGEDYRVLITLTGLDFSRRHSFRLDNGPKFFRMRRA
jgi:hypothetical protein